MDLIMITVWGFVLAAAIIIEIATIQFVSIWFAFAALVTLILAIFGTPLWAQLLSFVAVTALMLIITRPIVRKIRGQYVRTNADMNIGMFATVTEDIKNEAQTGRATIGGVSWKAVSEDGSPIPSGESVIIKDVDGAKLIVARKDQV